MSWLVVLYLIAHALVFGYQPVGFSPQAWAADARPYYQRITGNPGPPISIYYGHLTGAAGWTRLTIGGYCTGSIGISLQSKGDPEEVYILAHEMGHAFEGAACKFFKWKVNENQIVPEISMSKLQNVEQTAVLIALEVLAERCVAGEPDGCKQFWISLEKVATPSPRWNAWVRQTYSSGPLERLLKSRGGVVQYATLQKPLVMDDTWRLIYPEVEKIREAEARLR